MSILHLISQDSFIVVNQKLIDLFGYYEAGIVGLFGSVHNYSESECQRKGVQFDGWFYVTYDKIYRRLKLSENKAKTPIDNLEKAGIFFTKKEGVPCRKYFKFNKQKLIELLVFDDVEPSTPKNGGLGAGKTGDKNPKKVGTRTLKKQQQGTGKTGSNNKTNNKTNKNIYNLPLEVDEDLWNDFLEMRNEIKVKTTQGAKKLLIETLESFIKNGFDANESLKSSIKNNWKELYEPKIKLKMEQKSPQDTEKDKIDREARENERLASVENFRAEWENIRKSIKEMVGENAWNQWLSKVDFYSLEGNKITLLTPSKFLRDWIRREYLDKIASKFEKFKFSIISNEF